MVFYPVAVAICALSGVGETVLLDFQADWCGPCRSMQPVVAQLEAAGFPVRQVNIDREPQLAAQYHVSSIPCFVAIVNGQERNRQVGATGYDQLKQMLAAAGVQPQVAVAAGPRPGDGGALVRGQAPEGLLHRIHLPGFGRRSAEATPAEATAAQAAGVPAGGLAPPSVSMPDTPSGPPPAGLATVPPPADGGATSDLAAMPARGATGASEEPSSNSWTPNNAARGETAVAPSGNAAMNNAALLGGPAAAGPVAARGSLDNSALEQRLMAASVRLRVEDATGNSFGSGTIIDQRANPDGHGGEALVLTCGHIFRDSQGRGTIRIDRFDHSANQGITGRLLRYDLARDIALVTFKTDGPVPTARVSGPGHQSRQGDSVISIGCDNGQQPILRRSRVTAINSIVGPPNLQVAGQPAVGRSGGGLFDAEGRVIGVCNFADPQDHAGLFADVTSAREVLDQAGLSDIYRHAAPSDSDTSAVAASPPPMPEAMPKAPQSAPAAAAPSAATPTTEQNGPPVEVICIVRSGNGREARRETIYIDNASPDLVDRLVAEQRSTQAPFPTSLSVARGAPTPPAAAPPATQTASAWQPQWR